MGLIHALNYALRKRQYSIMLDVIKGKVIKDKTAYS